MQFFDPNAPGSAFTAPLMTLRRSGAFDYRWPQLYQNEGEWFAWKEDFLGTSVATNQNTAYDNTPTGSPTVGLVSNATGGVYAAQLNNTDEAQSAGLYWNDVLNIQGNLPFCFMARVKVAATPTSVQRFIIGLGSALIDPFDTMARKAWYNIQGGASITVETDDGTTDNTDKDTGEDIIAATWYWFTVSRNPTGVVNFCIMDGYGQKPRTWSMSKNFEVGEPAYGANNLQPILMVRKESGTTTPQILIDAYAIIGTRVA